MQQGSSTPNVTPGIDGLAASSGSNPEGEKLPEGSFKKKIKLDVWDQPFWLIVGDDEAGSMAHCGWAQGEGHYVFLNKKHPISRRTVVHECTHLVMAMLDFLGVKDEEAFAYTMDCVYHLIDKQLKKAKLYGKAKGHDKQGG